MLVRRGRPVTRGQGQPERLDLLVQRPRARERAQRQGVPSSEAVVLVGRIESWPPAGRRARRGGVQPHDVAGPRLAEEIGRPFLRHRHHIRADPSTPRCGAVVSAASRSHAARASARSRAEGTAPSSTSPWTRPQATLALPPAAAGHGSLRPISWLNTRHREGIPGRLRSGVLPASGVALLCECGFRRPCSSLKTPCPLAVSMAFQGLERRRLAARLTGIERGEERMSTARTLL